MTYKIPSEALGAASNNQNSESFEKNSYKGTSKNRLTASMVLEGS